MEAKVTTGPGGIVSYRAGARGLLALGLLLSLLGCGDRSSRDGVAAPARELRESLISDHRNSTGALGFDWIAPIVPSTSDDFTTLDPTGAANGLTVTVDRLLADASTTRIASFTGAALTMVTDASDGNFPGVSGPFYGVNWAAGGSVVTGETYRVSVVALTPARVLGVADVQVVPDATAAAGVDRFRFAPLIAGAALPIVFRLENQDTDGDTLNDWLDHCPHASCASSDPCQVGRCDPTTGECASPACSVDVPMDPRPGTMLYKVWGSSADDIYVRGWNGVMMHRRGTGAVSVQDISGVTDLGDIWGSSANDVYVLTGTEVIHSNGDDVWTAQPTPASGRLRAIWGSSSSDIYAVGTNGEIVHSTGNGLWSAEENLVGVSVALHAVRGAGPANVYAVGHDVNTGAGFILRRGGDSIWRAELANHPQALTTLWVSSASDIYVGGNAGTILHSTGDGTWTPRQHGFPPDANVGGMWAPPEGTPIYATAARAVTGPEGGSILRSSGTGSWTTVFSGTAPSLGSLWGDSANSLWVVGWGPNVIPGGYQTRVTHVSVDGNGCGTWEDDDNPCTIESCDPADGVVSEWADDGTSCADGNACNGDEICQLGACQAGTPIDCTASDACHDRGICDPLTGGCSNPSAAEGTPCDDGSDCTSQDACRAGACTGQDTCTGDPLSAISLRMDGVVDADDGRLIAVFGYDSTAETEVQLPHGPLTNSVSLNGNPIANFQPPPPASLHPGQHPAAFLPKFNAGDTIAWSAAGDTVTASEGALRLTRVPVGADGYGVWVGGTFVTIKPDLGQYIAAPAEPTVQGEPAVGAPFNGTLAGELNVSPTGAAVYTVPISIPPGVAGVAPNLSLSYNSQGGNGIAGQGWELSGLSVIHRCPRTRTHDGFSSPMNMNSLNPVVQTDPRKRDGLCLDGKRLFERSAGVYESEHKDFSVITEAEDLDYSGQDPHQYFKVVTKSGESRYYGSRVASRVLLPRPNSASGNEIAVWPLDRVIDAWGNYYDVRYNNERANFLEQGLVVTQIDYTGRLIGTAGSGEAESAVTPFSSVHFGYEPRPDVRSTRFHESLLPRNLRLKTIVTQIGTYHLEYMSPDPLLPSRLREITYCAAGGAGCLVPLLFDWQHAPYALQETPTFALPETIDSIAGFAPGTKLIDLNNDGRPDFVVARAGGLTKTWENTGHGWAERESWKLPASLATQNGQALGAFFRDIDGDGVPDLIISRAFQQLEVDFLLCRVPSTCPLPEVWLNRLKEGAGWQLAPAYSALPPSWPKVDFLDFHFTLADLNGDGRSDIVQYGPGVYTIRVLLSTDAGWLDPPDDYYFARGIGEVLNYHLEDANRDGLADLVGSETGAVAINTNSPLMGIDRSIWRGAGSSDPNAADGYFGERGDVDGDGLYDRIYSFGAPRTKKLSLASGLGFTVKATENHVAALARFSPPYPPIPINQGHLHSEDERLAIADLNADGLADLVWNHFMDGGQFLVNTGSTWQDLNNTDGWRVSAGPNPIPIVPPAAGSAFVDLNGDGVVDLVQSTTGLTRAWLNTFRPPVIAQFPNGLARKTQASYVVLSTAEAQEQGVYFDSAARPQVGTRRTTVPLRVVSSVSADNAAGGVSTTTYTYGSLRSSTSGYGTQGFESVTVKDASGLVTATTYAQAHPYTGMPISTVRFNQGLLSRTTTEYCDGVVELNGTLQCTPISGPPAGQEAPPGTSVFVYASKVVDTTMLRSSSLPEPVAAKSMVTTTEFRHDDRGNPVRTTVTTERPGEEKYRKEVINDFGSSGSRERREGKVTRSVQSSQKLAPLDGTNDSIERTTEFEYTLASSYYTPLLVTTLALSKVKVEPGAGPSLEQHTVYAYDRFGNVVTTTTCANAFGQCMPGAPGPASLPFRTSRVSYDPNDFNGGATGNESLAYGAGRFPVRNTNALGHTEYTAFDPIRGALVQQTGPNGVHTCYTTDAFGRRVAATARCGSANPLNTTVHQYRATSEDPEFAEIVTVTRRPTGGNTWEYTDARGRPVGTVSRSFDGGLTKVLTLYDQLGREYAVSRPFAATAQPAFWNLTDYDPLGRVFQVRESLGDIDGTGTFKMSQVTTTFQGGTVTTRQTVNGEARERRETKNALGKVASITDANQHTIAYTYDAEGNLTGTRDPFGNTTLIEYDRRGRKALIRDPDLGEWTYTYNSFGDVETQVDARGVTTTMSYDPLGRMVARADATGTEQWLYDSAPGAGIGKLAATVGAPDPRLNEVCSIPGLAPGGGRQAGRWFEYTEFGEIDEAYECIEGNTFQTSYSYDILGRQSAVAYPEVQGARLEVEYYYTTLGFLHYVADAADGSLYWAATALNDAGQLIGEYTRNGVGTVSDRNGATGWLMGSSSVSQADNDRLIQDWRYRYDEVGSLRRRLRSDMVTTPASEETFGYDRLDRLTTSRLTIPAEAFDVTETYDYDALGNLTQKGGRTYSYEGCEAGGRPAGPHAVCQVAGDSSFSYDDNGNMLSGSDRSIAYNAANKPIYVERATPGGDTTAVEFIYGPDNSRVVQVASTSEDDAEASRTVYVGMGGTGHSVYERTSRGSTVEHTQFIYAGGYHGGNPFAVRTTTEYGESTTEPAVKFYHRDHLGSVTAMSDDAGHVIDEQSGAANAGVMGYDPWGARRSPSGNSAYPGSFNPQSGHREFTGHETIPNVGLVNMNGRVYDPTLGRFLSPDPTVQFIANLQSYNRYSYVLNNPLRYTDPTGYAVLGTWGDIAVAIVFTAAIAACPSTGGAGCVVAFTMMSAIYTTTAVLGSGGSYEQAAAAAIAGLAAGQLSSALGGAAAQAALGGAARSVAAQVVTGAASGAVAAAMTTAVSGGDLGENVLIGLVSGGASAGVVAAIRSVNPVTQASQQEALGVGSERTPAAGDADNRITEASDAADFAAFQRAGHGAGTGTEMAMASPHAFNGHLDAFSKWIHSKKLIGGWLFAKWTGKFELVEGKMQRAPAAEIFRRKVQQAGEGLKRVKSFGPAAAIAGEIPELIQQIQDPAAFELHRMQSTKDIKYIVAPLGVLPVVLPNSYYRAEWY